MRINEKIKTLRKELGISQKQLADMSGVHITNISRIENGHYQPSIDVLKKLIKVFNVSADYLLNDAENEFNVEIKNKALVEKIRLIDKLDDNEQQALITVIDSMLTKKKILDLLTKKEVPA